MLEDGIKIQRNKIAGYLFDGFNDCVLTWQMWHIKNLLPFPGSWQEQPAAVIDMLNIFDDVYSKHEEHKQEMADLESKVRRR